MCVCEYAWHVCGGEFSLPHGHVVASAFYPLTPTLALVHFLWLPSSSRHAERKLQKGTDNDRNTIQQLTQSPGAATAVGDDSSVNAGRLFYSEYISKVESMRVPDGECVRKT